MLLQPNDLPLVCLPIDLSDAAAAALVEFLREFTEAMERHYAGQLLRYYHDRPATRESPTGAPANPPF